MSPKKIKVKDLASKYAISPKEAIKELAEEGIELANASSVVPEDMAELVYEHFDELVRSENSKDGKNEKPDSEKNSTENEIHIKTPIVVKFLAEALDTKPNELIMNLISKGVMADINQSIDSEIAEKIAEEMGYKLIIDKRAKEEHIKHLEEEDFADIEEEEENPEDLEPRAPVVAFLGHVDHGKTSLQDKVRSTQIAAGEAGGITQHIGASVIEHNNHKITFIDTPGHAAFTQMRARGANVTDIAILVVAADDGFMPQTIEAMNHIKAAGVAMIVAINKMDLPGADPDKILRQMQENEAMSEDWGGDIGTVKVSAETGEGIDELLERITLESEMLELKANPKGKAIAVVLEAQLEQGMGPTASILVKNGTLKIGDAIICGENYGRIKAMLNSQGKRIKKAPPSTPVKIVGLSGVPEAGTKLKRCKKEKEARQLAEEKQEKNKDMQLKNRQGASLEDLFAQQAGKERNDLNVVLKTDVQGSSEAIAGAFKKLPSEKIKVNVIHSSPGEISENDVMLAQTSNSIIIGFQTKVGSGINKLAEKEGVEIRLYSVIYNLLEDIIDALEGRLEPNKNEKNIGEAKILQIFEVSKGPNVCGCKISRGIAKRGALARVYREKELIFNGKIVSLRRFKDNVKEVRQGFECGIRLNNFAEFEEEDRIEIYEVELEKASL